MRDDDRGLDRHEDWCSGVEHFIPEQDSDCCPEPDHSIPEQDFDVWTDRDCADLA